MGAHASYEVCIILMTMGVVGSYYKGIIAMNCISGRFRVLTKMLMETFMDMIPFTVILVSQIMLFAILSRGDMTTRVTLDMNNEDEEP